MYENRIERAHDLFLKGYNCAQSVTAAFADIYGISEEQALKISSSFGGGIGRMRLTCGAACAMFLLAGMETGTADPTNREAKARNYAVVRQLADEFKEQNGSMTCSELLQLTQKEKSAVPSERTPDYYRKRPCSKLVRCAAKIYSDFLEHQAQTAKEK